MAGFDWVRLGSKYASSKPSESGFVGDSIHSNLQIPVKNLFSKKIYKIFCRTPVAKTLQNYACYKYAQICKVFTANFADSVLIRENKCLRKPVFWDILRVNLK